jgi:cell division protein FtsL
MRIDNSQVVREVDPRTSRDLWWFLVVVTFLVAGIGLYAWPHLEIRENSRAQERMSRERERLLEENRKLLLERASYSNLRRVETIAVRDLGLRPPRPEHMVVVEKPKPLPEGAQLARELKR